MLSLLPEMRSSASAFGTAEVVGASILIGGMAGDQQSPLFGQACFTAGLAKNTYGTAASC